MEKLTAFTKLLGEENEKRFKDTLTDKLIERIEEDIDDMGIYLIDFDNLFNDVRTEIYKEVKNRIYKKYIDKIESKIAEVMNR